MSNVISLPIIEYKGFEIHDRFPYALLHVKGGRQLLWEGSDAHKDSF